MSRSPWITRKTSLSMAVALLLAAPLAGCSRGVTLPPLVEEGAAPIPGKFVWRYSVITYHGRNLGGILDTSKEGRVAKGSHWLSAVSVPDLDAASVFYSAPIDRYGAGFYGRP